MRSRRPTIRIGKRFTERLGYELHQAATYCAKQDWSKAQATYEVAVQMLDTFLTETGLQEYMDAEAAKRATVEVPPSGVAAESEPPAEAAGDTPPAEEGAGSDKPASKRKPRANRGKKRDGGTQRPRPTSKRDA